MPNTVAIVGSWQAGAVLYQLLYTMPTKTDFAHWKTADIADVRHIRLLQRIAVLNDLFLFLVRLFAAQYHLKLFSISYFVAHAFHVTQDFAIVVFVLRQVVFVVLDPNHKMIILIVHNGAPDPLLIRIRIRRLKLSQKLFALLLLNYLRQFLNILLIILLPDPLVERNVLIPCVWAAPTLPALITPAFIRSFRGGQVASPHWCHNGRGGTGRAWISRDLNS